MGKQSRGQPRASYVAESAPKREPLTIDGESGKPLPPPPAKRAKHIRLRTADDVRAEAERVYRDARNGRIEPSEGTKLVYMLSQITTMIELGDIDRRLTAIEEATAEQSEE